MSHSWSFKISCLNSWNPIWYKTISLKELQNIWKGLWKILSLQELKPLVQNVWIESPKGKWRQLGIPNKSWRLYLHMLNMFLTYIYEPQLPKTIYHGFIYNRGCKSWWENLLWGPWLKTYSNLIELDFSSGFPNLSILTVKESLEKSGLLPQNIINLIITHLNCSPKVARTFPTLETYIEHHENTEWRTSNRSVHMGLGISPILFVITLKHCIDSLKLPANYFHFLWYADDGSIMIKSSFIKYLLEHWSWNSFFFFIKSIWNNKNPFLEYLNETPIFKEAGLRICSQKSGWVRILGIWLKPYKSLGLTYETKETITSQILRKILRKPSKFQLKASTRGRGANPQKNKEATLPSNTLLNFGNFPDQLDLPRMIENYKPYFGLILAKLYKWTKPPLTSNKLKYNKESLLGKFNLREFNKGKKKEEKINLYNCGSKITEFYFKIINNRIDIKEKRELRPKWLSINISPNFNINLVLSTQSNLNQEYEKEYFKKYSELKLTQEQLDKYKERYSKENKLE
jgi:hypothetical protein